MLKKSEFVRSHGLGNDYLVVDGSAFGSPLTEENIRRICDRHSGVGSDGILELVAPPSGFDAAVRIYNPDGSEAEKSGNGVRIFAKFCFDHGGADAARPLRIHTLGGPVRASLVKREADRSVLRVEMGRASFRCADLPMTGADEWIEKPLEVGGVSLSLTCVSMGNPHAVVFDTDFDEAMVKRLGPLLARPRQCARPAQADPAPVEQVLPLPLQHLLVDIGGGRGHRALAERAQHRLDGSGIERRRVHRHAMVPWQALGIVLSR